MGENRAMELKGLGLSVLATHIPRSPFRFEPSVSLGTCDIHPGVKIGMHSYMNDGFIRSGVQIGRYCSIGRNVTIGTGHHEMGLLSTSSFFRPPKDAGSLKLADPSRRLRVVVGHDVWIGDRALILSGVTIGNGVVIAAGAIVTHDVPGYAVVAGIPARVVRYRFSDDVVERCAAIKWWEFDPSYLKELEFGSIDETLRILEGWPDARRTVIVDKHIVI